VRHINLIILYLKIDMSSMNDIFKLQEMYKINDQEKRIENNLKKMGYIN